MKGYLGWAVGAWHCQSGSSRDALLIIENPCVTVISVARRPRQCAQGPSPLSVPLVPRFGVNHHGHSEFSTRGEYFPFYEQFCAQT